MLRIMIVLQTVALFAAPITAGLLLTTPHGHTLHSMASYTVFVVAVVHVVAAVLAWRPGGGSATPIMHATGFLLIVSAQVALGLAGATAVHVPLGVLLFGVSLVQASRLWPRREQPAAAPAADVRTPAASRG